MSNPELIAIAEIVRRYKYKHADQALAQLAHLGITPIYEKPFGKGVMRLYDEKAVTTALDAHFAEIAAERQQREAQAAPPEPDTKLHDAVAGLTKLVAATLNGIEPLAQQVDVIGKQGPVLLKAIEKVQLDLSAKIAALQETVDSFQISICNDVAQLRAAVATATATATTPVTATAEPTRANITKVAPIKRLRVTVVGLLASQSHLIEREFGDVFQLRFVQTDDARNKSFSSSLSHTDVVLAMTNFIDHGVENTVKVSKVRLVRVSGGMSALRDALTNLYVESHAKEAA